MSYDDHGRWTRTDRPELLSDRLGYPPERGDEDWPKHAANWERDPATGAWVQRKGENR